MNKQASPATFTFSGGPNHPIAAVAAALSGPMPNHTEPAFLEVFRALEADALTIMGSSADLLVIQAEGVVGLEAATRSLVGPGTRCLNVVNGVFSRGMGDSMRSLGAAVHDVSFPFDDVADPIVVDRALAEVGRVDVVALCHVETPCGTVNPLQQLAEVAHAHGAVIYVDAVASLGADPVRVDDWGLDLVVAATHKALGSPPGLSLVTVNEAAWRLIEANRAAPKRSILSLLEWRDMWLRQGHFPFTPSVAEVLAARAACSTALEEGIERCIRRHQTAAHAAREGAGAMGLRLWPKRADIGAGAATAIRLPDGVEAEAVVDRARDDYGVLLSTSYVAKEVVRIGHMGTGAKSISVVLALAALGRSLLDLGVTVDVGRAVEAAMVAYSDARPHV